MTLRRTLFASVAALGVLACAVGAQAQNRATQSPAVGVDARTTLTPGLHDAGQAASGLELEYALEPPPGFFDPEALFRVPQTDEEIEAFEARMRDNPPVNGPMSMAQTDMAMSNGRLFVGNFHGFNAYDVTRGGAPEQVLSVVCPGGQGDVSLHGNLLFMSVEQNRGRLDCGASGADGDVNAERFRGVRIFDISDLSAPRQIAAIQTCRGSHTHTQVPDPNDRNILYIYNSGTAGVRATEELANCSDGKPDENPDTALFSIDVIRVPLNAPQDAAIVNRPRIFANRDTGNAAGLWRGGAMGVSGQETARTDQCHDITVYPHLNRAAGACSGNGILLDISDPANPKRISEMFDPDMAYWHSATFNNAGDTIVFTDEWGGGMQARCRPEDPATWGANLIATTFKDELRGRSFFKLPGLQNARENCVAHNGNIIPVPGRDLMVQAWYQGGISVLDFTDPMHPTEIAYFDRGPIDAEGLVMGGQWSAYWFNGRIYGSEIARGLDVLKLVPNDHLSAAEIAAAEAVRTEEINPQTQTRIEWADTPDVASAYQDQLTRGEAIDAALATRIGDVVAGWRSGSADKSAATRLSTDLTQAATSATGAAQARLTALAGVMQRLGA